MKRLATILLLALTATAGAACSEDPTTPAHDYRDGDLLARPGPAGGELFQPGARVLDLGRDRNPVLYIPSSYDPESPAPLLVLFHGSDSSASFWEPLYGRADSLGFVMLMINSQRGIWDSFFKEGFGWDASTTDEALQLVFDHVAIDPERLAFWGFSAGATYTVELGLRNPELARSIVVLSGDYRYVPPEEPLARTFIAHGDQDEQIPVIQAQRQARALEMRGYDVTYVEFEGPHVLPFVIVDQALAWWLQ